MDALVVPAVAVALLLVVLLALTRGPVAALILRSMERSEPHRMKDPVYALLRREVEKVGREFEAMPYERLLEPAEVLSLTRVVDGV